MRLPESGIQIMWVRFRIGVWDDPALWQLRMRFQSEIGTSLYCQDLDRQSEKASSRCYSAGLQSWMLGLHLLIFENLTPHCRGQSVITVLNAIFTAQRAGSGPRRGLNLGSGLGRSLRSKLGREKQLQQLEMPPEGGL